VREVEIEGRMHWAEYGVWVYSFVRDKKCRKLWA
jgi:predicted lipoprotein with Yx(FWY)xxD motif